MSGASWVFGLIGVLMASVGLTGLFVGIFCLLNDDLFDDCWPAKEHRNIE